MSQITTKEISKAVKSDDKFAKDLIEEAAFILALIGLINSLLARQSKILPKREVNPNENK